MRRLLLQQLKENNPIEREREKRAPSLLFYYVFKSLQKEIFKLAQFVFSMHQQLVYSSIPLLHCGWKSFKQVAVFSISKSKSAFRVLGPGIWVSDPGPRTWDPGPNKCPKCWQIILDPFARTQIVGPKWLDVTTVRNVHVSTKSTVGTSEHSFKSVDKGR